MDYSQARIPEYLKRSLNNLPHSNAGFLFERLVSEHGNGMRRNPDVLPEINQAIKKALQKYGPTYHKGLEDGIHVTCKKKLALVDKLLLGTGSASVTETGMTLHPVYGFPYIPGQALKGLVRSFTIQEYFSADEGSALKDPLFRLIFGNEKTPDHKESQGQVIFFDAIPSDDQCQLYIDILTNHHMKYYTGGKDLNDREKPNPVTFYVAKGNRFDFYLSVKRSLAHKTLAELLEAGQEKKYFLKDHDLSKLKLQDLMLQFLIDAVRYQGLGAKTGVGYGFFQE